MRRSIRLSQNFLRVTPAIDKMLAASSIGPADLVLDIGAGHGSLTTAIAERARHVIAIETDPALAAELRARFATHHNVEIHEGDFMAYPLPSEPYKVFANIPFNRTSDIIHKLLDGEHPPTDSYLILQREAAEKFAGLPGRQSLFSTLHAPWFALNIVRQFRQDDFTPEPGVAVVLLQCQQRADPLVPTSQRQLYLDLVSYMFNHANPNILPSLQKLFPHPQFDDVIAKLGAHATAKPSQLPYAAWFALFDAFVHAAQLPQHRLIHGAASKLIREAQAIEKHHRTRSDRNWRAQA